MLPQVEDGNARTRACYVSFHILTAALPPQEKSEPRADAIELEMAKLCSLFRRTGPYNRLVGDEHFPSAFSHDIHMIAADQFRVALDALRGPH
jgi:hypothetical protein